MMSAEVAEPGKCARLEIWDTAWALARVGSNPTLGVERKNI